VNLRDKDSVRKILNRIKQKRFVSSYEASDAEAMGILMSEYFEYAGIDVMRAASSGLEDSNFHTENAKLQEMIAETEKLYQ
jgi:hypothetical protein